MTATCVRTFDFETRAAGGDGRTLEGYAAVFDTPARIRDMQGEFDERIARGAFARSLQERTPVLQFDHGKDPRVGTVPIGAIEELSEDARGLFVRARLFDNPVVEPVRQAIEGKAIRGMSFRFLVPDGGDTWTRSGDRDSREIRDADVFELGPVVHPAYGATTVGVRSLLAQLDPDEYRAMLIEFLEEIRASGIDLDALPDLTGRPSAVRAGGGDSDEHPRSGDASTSTRFRADQEALRLRGILK